MGDKPVPFRYRSIEKGFRPPIDRFTYLQKRLQQFKEGADKNLPQYLHIMCALAELELSKGMRTEALNHIKEVLSNYKAVCYPYKGDLSRRLWHLLEKCVKSPNFDQQDVDWIMLFAKLYGANEPYTEVLSFEEQSLVDKFIDTHRAGDCERALDEMQAAREKAYDKQDPVLLEIFEMKLRLFSKTHDSTKYEKAAERMLAIMEKSPTGKNVWRMESIIVQYIKFGFLAKAKTLMLQAEELYRSRPSTNLNHVRFLNNVGGTYLAVSQLKEAEAVFRLALSSPYKAKSRSGRTEEDEVPIDEEAERISLRCNVNDLISAYLSSGEWIAAENFSEFGVDQEERVSGENSILTNHARISLAELYSAHAYSQSKNLTDAELSDRATKSKRLFEKTLNSLRNAPRPDADEISATLQKSNIAEHFPALARYAISKSFRYTDPGINKYSILGMIFGDQEIDIHAAGGITVKSQPPGTLFVEINKRSLPERAIELLDQGKLQRAGEVPEAACMADMDGTTCSILGEYFSLTGDNQSAIQACNFAETKTPESAYSFSVRSLSYSNQNSAAEATVDAKTALLLITPGSTKDTALSKARCLLSTGEYSNAAEVLSSVLASDPKCLEGSSLSR